MKRIENPRLDLCVGSDVSVFYVTPDVGRIMRGRLEMVDVPWRVLVTRGGWERSITFAGPKMGINRIECDGETVYQGPNFPDPYPFIYAGDDKGLEELNKFRRDLLGEGFDYRKP
jgi:hypothetical protein